MGCPDAVRAALLKLNGVLEVTYHPDQDQFTVRFESILIGMDAILAAIATAGLMLGQTYVPEVVPKPSIPRKSPSR